MKLTITHKGTTVIVEEIRTITNPLQRDSEAAIEVIRKTIDKINENKKDE